MPEFGALSAALKGDPEMEAAQHELSTPTPPRWSPRSSRTPTSRPRRLRLRCIGVLGAAEAIATELVHGRATRDAAVDALAELILRGLTTEPAGLRPARAAQP